MRVAAERASGSYWSRRSWSTIAGSMRPTASSRLMMPSSTMSDAMRTAATAVRLAERVWSMKSRPRSIVNSKILHVAVVAFEALRDGPELGVDLRHRVAQLRDRERRADARHDVLALRVREVLAEERPLAGVRVPREGDARARVIAHVPEDHRHDVHGRAEVVRDLVVVAVVDGALAEPAREDRLGREVELLERVLREVAPGRLADDGLGGVGHLAQARGVHLGVLVDTEALLDRVERMVEPLTRDIEDDPPEHRDEAPVRIPAEALVAGERDQAIERRVVEAEVEDRVHHPRHRELRARADAHEERVGRVAEALAGHGLGPRDRGEDVVPQPGRQGLASLEVVVAGLGRDREAGRHRQAGIRHLGEPGALAPEQVAHRAVAFGAAASEGIDVALRRVLRSRGDGRGRGHG